MAINPNQGAQDSATPVPVRFLRQPEVLARVGVSWITLRRWEEEERFPKRRKIGKNAVAWVESEIDDWCANLVAGKQAGEGE